MKTKNKNKLYRSRDSFNYSPWIGTGKISVLSGDFVLCTKSYKNIVVLFHVKTNRFIETNHMSFDCWFTVVNKNDKK